MEIEETQREGILCIKPKITALDFIEGPIFKKKIEDILEREEGRLLLDFSEVTKIDSRGISALVAISLSKVIKERHSFALVAPSEEVKSALFLTHMETLFPIFPSIEEAVAWFLEKTPKVTTLLYMGKDNAALDLLQKWAPFSITITKEQGAKRIDAILVEEDYLSTFPTGKKCVLLIDRWPLDASLLAVMKAKTITHFLLKPLEEKMTTLFLNELQKELSPPISRSEKNVKADALNVQYRLSFLDKISLLEKSLQEQKIEEIKELLHKIAGSAGTYGLLSTGKIAKEGELFLANAFEKGRVPDNKSIESIIRNLSLQFGSSFQKTSLEKGASLLPVNNQCILLLSDDIEVKNLFESLSKKRGLLVLSEKDLENGKTVRPCAVFVEEQFLESNKKGLSIIAELKKEYPDDATAFYLLVNQESISLHLEAARLAIQGVIKKPLRKIDIEGILENIHAGALILPKVVVLDDDPDIGRFIQETLSEINIEVTSLLDETKILETLYRIAPDILFLDIHMPTYDGWALLHALRKDLRYRDLIIVIVTADHDAIYEKALNEGASDVFIKPLHKERLQKEVLRLANQISRSSGSPISERLQNQNEFKAALHSIKNDTGWLLLLGSDGFTPAKECGSGAEKEFIFSLENLILSHFKGTSLQSYLGEGLFALYFPNASKESVETQKNQFLQRADFAVKIPTEEPFFARFFAKIGTISELESLKLNFEFLSSLEGIKG